MAKYLKKATGSDNCKGKAGVSRLLSMLLVGGGFAITLPIASTAQATDFVVTTPTAGATTGNTEILDLRAVNETLLTPNLTTGNLTATNATTGTLTSTEITAGSLTSGNTSLGATSATSLTTAALTATSLTTTNATAATLSAGAVTAGTLTAGNTSTGNLYSAAAAGQSATIGNTTGTTTLTGSTLNINTANAAGLATTIGSTNAAAGAVTIQAGAVNSIGVTTTGVNVGTTAGSTVNVGAANGASTVNFNGNRLQNVGNAVVGTDAVNLNQLNSAVNGLQNQINQNKQGIAGVVAATNLPGLQAGQNYNIGAAWGNYQSYNGLSIGGHARISENVVLKVSGSAASGTYSGGAGLSIGF